MQIHVSTLLPSARKLLFVLFFFYLSGPPRHLPYITQPCVYDRTVRPQCKRDLVTQVSLYPVTYCKTLYSTAYKLLLYHVSTESVFFSVLGSKYLRNHQNKFSYYKYTTNYDEKQPTPKILTIISDKCYHNSLYIYSRHPKKILHFCNHLTKIYNYVFSYWTNDPRFVTKNKLYTI